LWLRTRIADIVRVLGKTEVWHADEFHVWNVAHDAFNVDNGTFDEWYDYAKTSGIIEFDE